jgi:UDP-glucose 4-epimerase
MRYSLLITWGLWYIWSHAVVEFEKQWYETVIVDNLSNSKIEVLDRIEKILGYKPKFYKIDLLDKDWLEQVFKENKFNWVVHFAALKAVWESCEKPFLYYKNNIVWSLNLFELMDKYWVKNIVFSSSATVYNLSKRSEEYQKRSEEWNVQEVWRDNDLFEIINWDIVLKRWLKESDPVWNTTNPYWTTKFVIENILRDLANYKQFKVAILRYFNPIWAHKSWLIWEDPKWIPNNLLPYILKVAIWELDKVKVFWNDYPTKDWTWERDYIHIRDLITWHVKALKFLEKENWPVYEEINLWTWKSTSVLEMIKYTEEVVWKKIPYEIVWRRPGDVAISFCDPTKAKKILNWQARYTIKEAIEDARRFVKNNL